MKPKSERKRVALYARVSSKDGRQEVANQLCQLREFSRRQGWDLIAQYVDRESGASSKRRPQFERMLAEAAERKFDILLFWSLDRLSREGAGKTTQYLERLQSNGVDWWSLREEYLRSIGPFAEAVLAILATMAKQERIRISERTRAGLERARAAGKRLGRPAADLDISRARAMRKGGSSLREIAQGMGVCPATVLHHLGKLRR
jgi:DNA invertase Pin-like site-specific DNA recombinase